MTIKEGDVPVRRADVLIQNAHVVTFDDDRRVVADGAIAITDGVIAEVGPTAELAERWDPARRVLASGQIAIPGLTDAHFHTAQTLMRGLISTLQQTRALRVPTWREYYLPFEAALTPEDVQLSGELAYTTMLAGGTTNFLESGGPHPELMASAAEQVGIRGTVTVSTMDTGSRIPESMITTTEQALARNVAVVDALPTAADGSNRVTGGMSLRQVITCSTELVTAIHAEAQRRGVKVHTHLVEGTYEIDYCLERYGLRPVDYLRDIGVFTPTLHGAHSVLAGDADISAYAEHQVSACHCAKGNYAIGAAPAIRMWRRGVPIGLGTDGVATLGTLDIFRVAMLARVGQQLVEATGSHNRNGIAPEEPLSMAIRGGARASGFADHLGALTAGRRADVVLVGTSSADAAGYASPEAFLYECASGRDVESVFVDGQQVVADGEVTTVDVERVRYQAARRQRELMDAIG
ncbi:amidohydrolase family protein [Ruania alba]|uniref:5-methylthioadenosine/S-adenosylhomocysteine deaminase n=1 Tax=Ruania alba TaxID=648782 RepID=A0A1H5MQ79_9MICO|nr:amidohydrolase family protein [Ruania alba]SEE91373.1 5-methylthioadenosine/S-adenosylhomocysteine deaminase [Ruania alba]